MDHVQILVLVACFVLVNLAQIADETLLMVCLFLQHQFLRNPALKMIEHCRRQETLGTLTQPLLLETSKTKPFPKSISENNCE